jgi:hypothetical protein
MATNFPELGTGGTVTGPANLPELGTGGTVTGPANLPELGTGGTVTGPATARAAVDSMTQARREERKCMVNPFFVEKLCTEMVPQKLQCFYNKSNRRVKQRFFSP